MSRNFVDENSIKLTVNDKIYVDVEIRVDASSTLIEAHALSETIH